MVEKGEKWEGRWEREREKNDEDKKERLRTRKIDRHKVWLLKLNSFKQQAREKEKTGFQEMSKQSAHKEIMLFQWINDLNLSSKPLQIHTHTELSLARNERSGSAWLPPKAYNLPNNQPAMLAAKGRQTGGGVLRTNKKQEGYAVSTKKDRKKNNLGKCEVGKGQDEKKKVTWEGGRKR